MKIRVAIMGYGNLGKGIECAIRQNEDMELVAVFTRRAPETVKTLTNVPVYAADKAPEMKDDIDVLMLCGGSATDLPSRQQSMRSILMSLTALIPTQRFRSILSR